MNAVGHLHSFHIPVMGTSFTVDTPLKVAKFGIASCISLGDDHLIERARKAWSRKLQLPFSPISERHNDARAARITAYLNFVHAHVDRQIEAMKRQSFGTGSDLDRYFQMLPECALAERYRRIFETLDGDLKQSLMDACRSNLRPGNIDVNIMTKVNRERYRRGVKLGPEMADALSALRGFVLSEGPGAVVFSAGMNPRLFSYAAEFESFLPDAAGHMSKKIILKVSDYRSALVQGQFFAKKGLWVSEFRVESGLNCGGHAFAKDGLLLGSILNDFKNQRNQLRDRLFDCLKKALENRYATVPENPPELRITAQGGIGTADEDVFLRKTFELDGTGWGTPFLLVPEASMVDAAHLELLQNADENEVFLSRSSPFGVPFWSMRHSASEQLRAKRVESGRPGSPCKRGYLAFNTEFGERPLCTGSTKYQKLKLEEIRCKPLNEDERQALEEEIQAKACICHDLGGSAALVFGETQEVHPAICPGPNISYFSKLVSLKDMVAHIYGRSRIGVREDRLHMFINEGRLYLNYLRDEIRRFGLNISSHSPKSLSKIRQNMLKGCDEYKDLARAFVEPLRESFLSELRKIVEELELLRIPQERAATS